LGEDYVQYSFQTKNTFLVGLGTELDFDLNSRNLGDRLGGSFSPV